MKNSKRNQSNAAAQAQSRASGKPAVSKYAAKGGPFKYGEDEDLLRVRRIRGF